MDHPSHGCDPVPLVDVRSLPLGGRVRYGAEGLAQRHIFGSVATPTSNPINYQAFTQAVEHRDVHLDGHCPRTWVVSLTGREIQRVSDEVPLAPLPLTAFDGGQALINAAGANAVLVPRSQLKFQIAAQLDSGMRVAFADAGQSFEVQANRVCISWLAPTNFIEVTDRTLTDVATGTRLGFVVDALLGASAAAIEAPIGNPTFTFTTHLFVPAATQGIVVIPPFATQVTIYQQATVGSSSVMWTQRYGDPAVSGSLEIGALPFIVGQRRTQQESVLPDATHLRSDTDPDAARWFTLRWTMRL